MFIEQKIKDFLFSRDEIISAYVFGSFPENTKFNDIDIAVYLRKDYDYKDLNEHPYGYESELLGKLNLLLKTDKIDLVVLNHASLSISKQIYNSGKLLFEKDRFFRVYTENAVRKEYIDTEHFRKIQSFYLNKHIDVR